MKWKVVFWLFLVLGVFEVLKFPIQENINIYNFLGLMLLMFSLIVIYGNAYQIAIGNKKFAITVFSINLIVIGYISFILILTLINSIGVGEKVWVVLSILTAFVYILPIYRYAFMSNDLWNKTHIKSLKNGTPPVGAAP